MIGLLTWVGSNPRKPPLRIAATADRYLIGVLARHVASVVGREARFVTWAKAEDSAIRSQIEEASLFGPRPVTVVLGAPKGWMKSLRPSAGTYVIAQQPEAKLQGERYSWPDRKVLLRPLTVLMGLPWGLRDLDRVDWTWATGWEDFEPLLAKGRLLSWTADQLVQECSGRIPGDVFALARDREWWSIHFFARRYGAPWLTRHLRELTVQVIQFHALVERGVEPAKAGDFLGLPKWQGQRVREAADGTSAEVALEFARRMVELDPAIRDMGERGLDLLLMGARLQPGLP